MNLKLQNGRHMSKSELRSADGGRESGAEGCEKCLAERSRSETPTTVPRRKHALLRLCPILARDERAICGVERVRSRRQGATETQWNAANRAVVTAFVCLMVFFNSRLMPFSNHREGLGRPNFRQHLPNSLVNRIIAMPVNHRADGLIFNIGLPCSDTCKKGFTV
jgi:hypothetical protein